ncbi:hypothetical protein [Nocardia jejuensis]|uniref:hypothetical protein n=1 Tax=Nocardia jejuensis TaxID=328049 RepID=UPI00082CDC74|nr:hypothetical protein [Nocardia jejuensis]
MGFEGGGSGSNRERFGQRALRMVREKDAVATAEFDAGGFAIVFSTTTGERGRIDLTAVFLRSYTASAATTERMLAEFIAATPSLGGPYLPASHFVAETPFREDIYQPGVYFFKANAVPSGTYQPETWALTAPRLRPLIRQAGFLDLRMDDTRAADHTMWRPILPGLIEKVIVDQPTVMGSISPDFFTAWGVDADTVFATAHANLAGTALDMVADYDPGKDDGILDIPDEDGNLYMGSLPVMDGWLTGIGAKAGARPIVFVARSAGLLLGAEFSPQHVQRLVTRARQLFDTAERPVSPVPYTVDDTGRLIPFRVPREHPAWAGIRSATAALAVQVYEWQHDYLERDRKAGLLGAHPAKLLHSRSVNGVEYTSTRWTDGVPTLLPRAHVVTLTDTTTSDTVGVTWKSLAAALDLRPAEGFYPPRYRVEFHPDAETMAQLRAAPPHL